MLGFNCSAGPVNDMPILILGQGAHSHIFLSPPPPNGMVCSVTLKHRHVHTYTIYKFICLSPVNLKYSLRTGYIGCASIHYDIEQVHAVYKREVIRFLSPSHAWLSTQNKIAHTNLKCAYVFQGEDGNWCLYNIKVKRIYKWPTLSVCYCAFAVSCCFFFFVHFTYAGQL